MGKKIRNYCLSRMLLSDLLQQGIGVNKFKLIKYHFLLCYIIWIDMNIFS